MNVMDSDVQWFLARDGKQHGPLSSTELKKLVELGHLKQTDLLWRQGFADWRPAPSVFQTDPAAQPQTAPPQAMAPAASQWQPGPGNASPGGRLDPGPAATTFGTPATQGIAAADSWGAPTDAFRPARDSEPKKSTGRRVLVAAVFMLALIGTCTWLAFKNRDALYRLASMASRPAASSSEPGKSEPVKAANAAATPEAAAPSPEVRAALDARLQKTIPWPIVKQEFPDWYGERLAEFAKLSAAGKSDADMAPQFVEALVALRRKHADAALTASTGQLKTLATAFLDNLKVLTQEGPDTCYGFISKGEVSPGVVALMQNPEKNTAINAQLSAIFTAIAEGRKAPVTHTAPLKTDYTVLTAKLGQIGWSQADIQLFANPVELAKAPHERVCKMVQDWFTAHLAIEDQAVQERLLIETLRPVVAG